MPLLNCKHFLLPCGGAEDFHCREFQITNVEIEDFTAGVKSSLRIRATSPAQRKKFPQQGVLLRTVGYNFWETQFNASANALVIYWCYTLIIVRHSKLNCRRRLFYGASSPLVRSSRSSSSWVVA